MAMLELTYFPSQNWIITPAALSLTEARPQTPNDQKWQLVLSGIASTQYTAKGTDIHYRRDTFTDRSTGYTVHWVLADNGRVSFDAALQALRDAMPPAKGCGNCRSGWSSYWPKYRSRLLPVASAGAISAPPGSRRPAGAAGRCQSAWTTRGVRACRQW